MTYSLLQKKRYILTDFYNKARSFIDRSNITSIDLSSLHSFFNDKRGATRKIIFLLSFQNLYVDMQAQKMKFRRNCHLGVSPRCLHLYKHHVQAKEIN